LNYVFQFSDVWAARDELVSGTLLTVELSAISMMLSLIVAVFGAFGRVWGPWWLRQIIGAYVEFIRNTPFLVQVFVIFYGLPQIGFRMNSYQGALVAMVLNGSAYTIEIVRAGIEAVSRGQLEAATALGLHRIHAFRLVVLPQAIRAVFAPLGSQFILLMLNSSIVSVISVNELTAAAQNIQGRTFRAFEVYIVATAIYFVLANLFGTVFALLHRWLFPKLGRN
jgi:polar amino acid transport system permease protein